MLAVGAAPVVVGGDESRVPVVLGSAATSTALGTLPPPGVGARTRARIRRRAGTVAGVRPYPRTVAGIARGYVVTWGKSGTPGRMRVLCGAGGPPAPLSLRRRRCRPRRRIALAAPAHR
ncbi:hypothetical protein GCM10023224_41980 [Streptomonospora halophila]|uniref:Uncharacterized protein n=1 Tax=Streptomonospora halophila TaxID=427369 RepID=A0ABP9GTI5_9ACTN